MRMIRSANGPAGGSPMAASWVACYVPEHLRMGMYAPASFFSPMQVSVCCTIMYHHAVA